MGARNVASPRVRGVGRRYGGRLAALFVLSGCINQAWAWNCDKIGPQYETINLPSRIAVPRDLAVNSPITGWFYSTQVTSRYCTATAGSQYTIGVSYQSVLSPVSGVSITGDSGRAAQVYYTPLAGVGVAFQAYGWQCSGYSPWDNVLTYNSIWWGCTGPASNYLAGRMAMRLVKIGSVSPGWLDMHNVVKQIAIIDGGWDWGGENTRRWFDPTGTTLEVAGCITPDVTVNLGEHGPAAFQGVGSTTAPVNFTININSCPAGLSGVWYGFNYPSEAFRGDTAKGIINLDAASTAKGVAVQMLDGNGNPVVFDQWFNLPGYNAAGGNYQLQMKARYIQRTATVTPGTANTYILLVMHYH